MRRISPTYRENAIGVVVLALFVLAAFLPVVFLHRAPCTIDSIFFQPPWEDARPAGMQPPTNPDAALQAQRYLPWYAYLNSAHARGDSMLWNPLEGCGIPFFAQWRTRCLSPFSLPFYFQPLGAGLAMSVLLKVLLAGWCAFYAARRLGFPAPVALLPSVAFAFSGPVFLWSGFPASDVVPWLPLLLLVAERFAVGQYQYWPAATLVVALMALGGDPETLAASLLFTALFLFLRTAWGRSQGLSIKAPFVALAVSVLLGLALIAVQIVPYLEFLREAAPRPPDGLATALRPKHLLACFLPEIFGAVRGAVTDEGALANPRVIMLLHIGLVQLWLLPLWFSVRGFVAPMQRQRIESMLLAAVVMTVLAMLAHRQLGEVPLLRRLGPEHLLVGNALAFGFISAAAAEEWVLLNAEQCRAALKRLPIFAVLLGILGLACVLACRHMARPGAWPFWLAFIVATAMMIALLIIIGMTLLKPSLRLVGYSLAALTFLSLLIAFKPGVPFIDQSALFPETPFITTLRDIGERIGGSDTLAHWPLAGNLIPQFYSPSGYMLERHAKLVERVKADPTMLRRVGAPALLLTKQDIQGAFASMRPALAIKHVFPSGAVLFKDLETKPRAWVTYDWRVEEHFDPAAIHASLSPIVEGAAPPGAPAAGPEAKVTILKPETSARVRVEVTTERPGILVLADACYPGWRAAVNGHLADILPVDGLFRGVPISEGKHQVEFFYAPVSLQIGSDITMGVGLLLLIGMRRLISHRLRKHSE